MPRGKKQATAASPPASNEDEQDGQAPTVAPPSAEVPASTVPQAPGGADSPPISQASTATAGGKELAVLRPVQGKAGDYCRWRSRARTTGALVGAYDINVAAPNKTVA